MHVRHLRGKNRSDNMKHNIVYGEDLFNHNSASLIITAAFFKKYMAALLKGTILASWYFTYITAEAVSYCQWNVKRHTSKSTTESKNIFDPSLKMVSFHPSVMGMEKFVWFEDTAVLVPLNKWWKQQSSCEFRHYIWRQNISEGIVHVFFLHDELVKVYRKWSHESLPLK